MTPTFHFSPLAPRLSAFRNCFEGGFDFDTALGCAGLSTEKPAVIDALRRSWNVWLAKVEG